jgi:uncharacterized peroxidase-related enzyme
MVDRFAVDWRTAGVDEPTAALLAYTEKLTREPADCAAADIDVLRGAGLSDRAINDGVQVCAYFNYINRIADALGVVPEDWIDEAGRVID